MKRLSKFLIEFVAITTILIIGSGSYALAVCDICTGINGV